MVLMVVTTARAVLCRDGLALALSEDHKPDRKDEKARVEQAGGVVVNIGGIWRVCTAASSTGIKLHYDDNLYLATSRAFGDRLLKGDHGDLVSSVPEIKCQSGATHTQPHRFHACHTPILFVEVAPFVCCARSSLIYALWPCQLSQTTCSSFWHVTASGM
jgi:serine/threonine protein phosphatase PrpC